MRRIVRQLCRGSIYEEKPDWASAADMTQPAVHTHVRDDQLKSYRQRVDDLSSGECECA